VSLSRPVAEGSEFRWKAGPGTITSTIRQLDRPSVIGWTGKSLGLGAIHVWRLESRGERTLVKTEESWAGLPARILRGRMQKMLQKELDDGLRHLKAEAERRVASASATD
jgi:Polyketide cyclase / dehydrase and lipid transport